MHRWAGPVSTAICYSPYFSQYLGLLTVAGPKPKNAESRHRWCQRNLPRIRGRACLSLGAPSAAAGCRVGRAPGGTLAPWAQAAAQELDPAPRPQLFQHLRNKSEFPCIFFTGGIPGET